MDLIACNERGSRLFYRGLDLAARAEYALSGRHKWGHILQKNARLRELRRYDTCFVVGNGPSLNQTNLSLLEGKDVITVNAMVNTPLFAQLRPRVHLVQDRTVLAELAPVLAKLARKPGSPAFLLHRSGLHAVGLAPNAFYLYGTLSPCSADSIRADLTRPATGFINVLPQAALCAMYMGYRTVALVGNDFSFFARQKQTHFYEETGRSRDVPLYRDLQGCAIACQQYRWLYAWAGEHGVRLVNATPASLLDELPRVPLESLV